jgi:hypothetical protein
MTVEEYAQVLLNVSIQFVHDAYYTNREGQTGYRAIYRHGNSYFWYSVSRTEVPIAPDEVAQAITDPARTVFRANPYFNRNSQQGFEATVRAGEHCFMLNSAPDPPGF